MGNSRQTPEIDVHCRSGGQGSERGRNVGAEEEVWPSLPERQW